MKTLIPLYVPTGHPAWAELAGICQDKHLANQITVVINPAAGPGPDGRWQQRPQWLAHMATLRRAGARLALYVGAQAAVPSGIRIAYERREATALLSDLAVWRERYLDPLGEVAGTYYLDAHPARLDDLGREELTRFYRALDSTDRVIANVRTMPSAEFARACPAHELVVHEGNGWPPAAEPTLGGKPTHLLVCNSPGLKPGAKHMASSLYVTPTEFSGGVWIHGLSPSLSRILSLNP